MKTVGITSKNKHLIEYANLPAAFRLVSNPAAIQVPVFKRIFSETFDPKPVLKELICATLTPDAELMSTWTHILIQLIQLSLSWQPVSSNPEVSNQNELNDLLRDMNLSKKS